MRTLGRRLTPRSLRVRIMITLVGLVATLGIVALVRAANDMVDLLEHELDRRGTAIARDIAAHSAGPSLTNDVFALYEVVNDTLVNNPDVRYIFLVEPSGDVRVRTFAGGVPLALVAANAADGGERQRVAVLSTTEGPVVDVAVPIADGQGGTVRVGMSEAGLREVVINRVSRLGLLVVAAFVAAVAASFFLASLLTRPLARLAEAARSVGRGELGQKVPVDTADEFGDLARAFNSMTDALAESRDDLMRSNEELRILNTMADHLSRHARGETLAETSLQKLLELTDLAAGWICLRDGSGDLSLAAYRGIEPRRGGPPIVGESRCECRDVLQHGRPIVVEGYPACPLLAAPAPGVAEPAARAVLPLFSGDAVIGVLVVNSDREFAPNEIDLLTSVGQQVGIALENARLYGEVQAKERTRGDLLKKLIGAQEEERKRVAREIHDEPTQALSGIVMGLDRLERHLPAELRAERADVETAKQSVRGAMESLHRIMLELRPSALDDLGLVPAIRWYAEGRLGEAEIELDFHANRELGRLDPEVEVAIFRLAQEAINNIYKHSHASHARIRLDLRDSSLHGTIEDDGRGFAPALLEHGARRAQAVGLAGMEERARLLGGEFSIVSQEDAGTKIVFEIPLRPRREHHDGETQGPGR